MSNFGFFRIFTFPWAPARQNPCTPAQDDSSWLSDGIADSSSLADALQNKLHEREAGAQALRMRQSWTKRKTRPRAEA